MNTILGFAILSLALWVFIERRKNRHFKKQFRKGTYWMQYYPFCSYDLATKLHTLNNCEAIQIKAMADEVSLDFESPTFSAVSTKTFDASFIKMELKRSDGNTIRTELAGYELIYTSELVHQAKSLGVRILSIDEIV